MDEKIIGAGIVAASVITIDGLLEERPIVRPVIGAFIATFLLSAMSAAGLSNIAGNLAILLAGTVVVLYGAGILKEFQKL